MSTFNELWGISAYNSWARVPRGPLAAAVGSFLFGATATAFTVAGAAITWGTIGGFLITTAISSWAMGALMPKPKGAAGREGILSNRREPVGNFDIVYGRVRKGGVITFMESTGNKNKYLHFIVTLAGHEVEAIEDVYINENIVTLDANGFVTADPWKSKVRVKKMLGSPTQAAQPELVSETSIDANFRGRGIAYLYVRLEYDNEVFADGIPNFTAVVKGKKVFDPRTSTTVWSDNAALCIRDYLSDPLGVNSTQSPASLTSDSWTVGADVSDSLVTKKDTSTEKRYTLNGVVSTANTPRENLQQMLTSCGGTLFWGQGQWQFKAGYFPSGPYISLGMDDLRSGISLVTKNSRKENFNSVSGVFVNSGKDWVETEYPRVSSSVFLAQDNGQENSLDMELPYTTSASAAQRLAKMAMFRSREEIVISANFSLKASKIKVGDVVSFSFERYGFTDKYFEVLSWKLVSESSGLVINMTMKETSAAAYDWSAEEKDILDNNTILPQPREGLTVTNLVVTNKQTLQSDGTFLGEVLLSWNPADNAFVYRYDVQWRKNAESAWSSTQTTQTEVVIPSIKSGILYTYRVRAVSIGGFVGAWEQVGATVSGKDTPPGLPTSVQTKNLYRAVQVTWSNPTDSDLNHIEIHTNTTNTTTGATKVGESGGTKFIYDMEPAESRWFFLKAVDHSGNTSAFTAGIQGTALFIEQSDVNIDVGQLLNDAGLNAVEVFSSLPTTGNYDGRTVYNTTDRQLYIYDGVAGQWKLVVEPFDPNDLILDKDNFPSDLKPVEILSALPTAGNFEGRVVMLLSDGKLYRYKSGAFTAAVPTVDLTGTISSDQIANNAINTAKFATGIRPVEVVSTLPTTDNVNGRTVVLTTDGKLYRYYNNAWTASVPSSDITGELQSSQIAAVAASKVTGQLTDSQIAAIGAAKVTGQLANSQIADIAAAKVTGQIVGAQITDSAISAIKLADSAVTSVKIANDAVGTAKIAIGAITGTKISDNAVTTAKIDALAITADKIAANAIVAGKIQAGAVGADKIAANAIIASKIAVGDFSNLIIDSDLQDEAYWIKPSNVTLSPNYGDTNVAPKSKGAFIVTPPADTTVETIIISKPIPVKPGEEFFAKATIGATHAHSSRIYIQFLDKDLAWITSFVSDTYTSLAFGDVSVSGTAPSNARYTRLVLQVLPNGYASTQIVFTGPTLRRKNEGALIVDGAIVSDKLATNAVVADKISANAITAVKIDTGAVTTAKIDALAITANKIATNAIVAGKIEAGAVTTAKIDAGAVTALKIATGAIIADKIDSNAVTADKIAANAITAGKIQAGAIGADQIAAGAIVATKLAVADATNLVVDDQLQDPSYWALSAGQTLGTSPAWSHTRNVVNVVASTTNQNVFGKYFDAVPGDELFASFQSSFGAGTGYMESRAYLMFYDKSGTQVSLNLIGTQTARSATPISNSFVVPVDAYQAKFRFYVPSTNEVNVVFASPVVRRKNKGELIVDGAITASKIATNAVTADKIEANAITAGKIAAGAVTASAIEAGAVIAGKIATDAITAGKIAANAVTAGKIAANAVTAGVIAAGAVNAAAIEAGAVTADKINVNNLAAINANLGAITGGSINIASKFIVDSAGTATIQSGTTGERLVITNNRIDVYDASGALRVRLGQL